MITTLKFNYKFFKRFILKKRIKILDYFVKNLMFK